MFRLRWLIGSFCLALLLAGCAGQVAPPNTSNGTTSSAPAAGIPSPASDQVGIVTGKLLNKKPQDTLKPLRGAPIYLGKVLKSQQGVEGMVELAKETAPKATVDAQGQFVFTDVPPGHYGLMLDTPLGAILLNKPVTGDSMVADVVGGKTFDFGELHYELDIDFK